MARMSREIRTPMNTIIGITALAQDHVKEPEIVTGYLSKIELSSKLLLSIINDVLDMSSIESGKLKIEHTQFSMSQIVSSLTELYYLQCKAKGIAFRAQLGNTVDELLVGDSLRLNQILMNLLSNAVKFTERGEVKLVIEQRVESAEKLFLHIVVTDTGRGMSEDMQERLWKPFEQESASTARQHGGSGLGLAIVGKLAGLMGGTVRAESKLGAGTSFTVELPFERCLQKHIEMDPSLSNMRVLVVDDEPDALDYVSSVLGKIGVAYAAADSGNAALSMMEAAHAEGKPFNVCIVDWKMPGMGGVETTERIRKAYGDDTLIIIASAYDYSVISEEAKDAGVDKIISKPLFPSSLYEILLAASVGGTEQRTKSEFTCLFM